MTEKKAKQSELVERPGAQEPTSPTDKRRANALRNETSTYLLQHAYNPVDWYPWSHEALRRARDEDKPILLSIGYSACHWCHVMEHESFEDESTAELMNRFFVNIKVDREERPDLDEIYMKAVQMLTGHGGWPMTVFLTPELKPFYAGTYFPPQDRHGIPSFKRILLGVRNAWESQRNELEESSAEITAHLDLLDKVSGSETELNVRLLDSSLSSLLNAFDRRWGGFGGAPKFPHSQSLSLAMRRLRPLAKNGDSGGQGQLPELEDLVKLTLNRMYWGGIYDHLGGGFARYSVDRRWLIPHFEKMLYDNALIPRNYFDGYILFGESDWLELGKNSLDFVLRELSMPEGGFYCSLDADSEGEEGKYYVWTKKEIEEALGKSEAEFFCDVYDVTEKGNFEHGKSALNFPEGPEAAMQKHNLSAAEFWKRILPLKAKLLEVREARVRPGRDDKMLTSWSGLMISCLLDGYRVCGEQRYLHEAIKAANFILEKLKSGNRLLRTYGRGVAKLNAYLDDYAYFIQALLDLSSCDANPIWLSSALELNAAVIEQFWDKELGGFFYTSDDHEKLIARTKNFYDGSTPSASSVACMNFIRLARLCGNSQLQDMAEKTIRLYAQFFLKAPDQFANMLCCLDAVLAAPVEIAVLHNQDNAESARLFLAEIYKHYLPSAVIAVLDTSHPEYSRMQKLCPLFEERGLVNDEKVTVYICSNFACQKPISDLGELKQALAELRGK